MNVGQQHLMDSQGYQAISVAFEAILPMDRFHLLTDPVTITEILYKLLWIHLLFDYSRKLKVNIIVSLVSLQYGDLRQNTI